MMYSEFLEITGASEKAVPYWYYKRVIEPLYNEAMEGKRTWCAIYAPGLIAAFKTVDSLATEIDSAHDDLREAYVDLESENKRLKDQLNAYEVYFDDDKRNREEMEERLWRAR